MYCIHLLCCAQLRKLRIHFLERTPCICNSELIWDCQSCVVIPERCFVNWTSQARLRVPPQYRYRKTQQKTPRQVQRPHDVGVHAVEHGETCCMIPQKPKTRIKMRTPMQHGTRRRMICRNGPASISRSPLPQEPSRKVVSGKHSIFHTLSEGPKLRSMRENENYKGPLQKTHW